MLIWVNTVRLGEGLADLLQWRERCSKTFILVTANDDSHQEGQGELSVDLLIKEVPHRRGKNLRPWEMAACLPQCSF